MTKKPFKPVKHPGKLHRELHIPEGETIPQARLKAAEHSRNRTVRNDAIRADTMEHKWSHPKHSTRRVGMINR